MDEQGTRATLVQRVRTFASDAARAQAGRGATPPVTGNARPPATPPATVSVQVPIPRPALSTPSTPIRETRAGIRPTAQPPPNLPTGTPTSKPPEAHAPSGVSEAMMDIRQESDSTPREAVMVKDMRAKQWTLGKAISESLSEWVAEKKEALSSERDRVPAIPNVPPPDTRAEVLRAARAQSVLAPKDDRKDVVAKLRTFAGDTARVTAESRASAATPHPAPTHRQEPALKQARRVIRPIETAISRSYVPPQEVKSLVKDVAPQSEQILPESTFVKMPEGTHTPRPRRALPLPYGTADIAPRATQRQGTRLPEPVPEPLAPSPAPSRDISFIPPTFDAKKATTVRTYRDDAIHDVKDNGKSVAQIAAAEAVRRATKPQSAQKPHELSPRPFVIAGIVMVVTIAVGGIAFFRYASEDARDSATIVRIPTFMRIDAQQAVPFSTNRAALLDTLDSAVSAAGHGITQLYPARATGSGQAAEGGAIATGDFMYVLEPRAPGSFIRNLTEEMMFGAHNGTAPFFIFKPKQFDTAFAGMLDWEPYIAADLAPLFDPRAHTGTTTEEAPSFAGSFVDETLRNVDTRILYTPTGGEQILYAFADKQTLIITTSSATLIEILERLR